MFGLRDKNKYNMKMVCMDQWRCGGRRENDESEKINKGMVGILIMNRCDFPLSRNTIGMLHHVPPDEMHNARRSVPIISFHVSPLTFSLAETNILNPPKRSSETHLDANFVRLLVSLLQNEVHHLSDLIGSGHGCWSLFFTTSKGYCRLRRGGGGWKVLLWRIIIYYCCITIHSSDSTWQLYP